MQEDFIVVCAWCHKILQQPLATTYNEHTICRCSHGICEECFASIRYEIGQIHNQRHQITTEI
jgi:hypothetical protein